MSLTEFMRVQTRPNLVFNGPGGKKGEPVEPTPVRATSPHLVTWDDEPDSFLRQTNFPTTVVDASTIPRSRRIKALIRASAGIQRHEASHAFNAHRAFPSAQAKYPAELFVAIGETTWHYDASWDALRPVGPPTNPTAADVDPWPALDDGAPAFLAILGRPNRLPAYYRELQWALTLCEEGHLAALATQLARVLGFTADLLVDFDDQGLLERIGAIPGDTWFPGAVIALDNARPEFQPSQSNWPIPTESWLSTDRQAWLSHPSTPAQAPTTDPAPTPPPHLPSHSWSSVLFNRSGGRSPGGLTASPERLPSEVLTAALSAAQDAAADWLTPDRPPVEIHAVVQRVADLEDGVYTWDPATRQLIQRQPGAHLAAAQQAFYYPRTVTRVDTCNVALCLTVDYAAALAAEGPRGLRLSQLRFGAVTQPAALTCAAHDAFLRPCRSFDPDALAALLHLPATHTVGYLCLLGRSRFTDLQLDLRP